MKNSMQINGTMWVKKTSNREPLSGLPEGCWKAVPNGVDWKEILVIQRSAVHKTKWVFQRYRFNGSRWVVFNRSEDSLTMLVSDRKLSVMFEHGSLMLKREEATATATPEPVPPVETTPKQSEAVVSGSEVVPVAAVEPTPEAVAEVPPLLPTFRSRLQFKPENEESPTVEAVAAVADCEFLEFHGCVHSSESSRLFERLLKPNGVSDYVATETHPLFNPESGQWETWSRSFCWFTYAGTIGSNGERMTEEEKSETVRKLRVEYGIAAHVERYNPNRENIPGNATVVCVRVESGVGLPQWFYRSFDLLGRGIPGDLQPVSVVR